MHSFLIQSISEEVVVAADTLIIEPENSIGIEEVRQIQSFLSKKPTQAKHNSVYIKAAHLLTLPAQNALLKTLEEPPGNAMIYLVTTQPDLLLPTVLSRVQIENGTSSEEAGSKDLTKTKEILSKVRKLSVGEKLAAVDAWGFTREQALEFLNEVEYVLHADLSTKVNYSEVGLARKHLKANVNTKLVLDHLLFNLYS